jgi:hypothetical protein
LNRIANLILSFAAKLSELYRIYRFGPSGRIDLSGIFPARIEDIVNGDFSGNMFSPCDSNDEYDRDVVDCYRCHRASFYLDRTHRDGHFRV